MLYAVGRFLAMIVLMPLFFVKIIGKKNAMLAGGSVVICKHKSNWDPIVLGFSVKKRPVCYMAKEELFNSKFAACILRHLYVIPVARGKSDIKAIKTAISKLNSGSVLGIFPEGTRSKELLEFEPGAAMLALKSDVPVVPVYIKGNYKLFHRIKVFIDPPIYLKEFVGEKVNSESVKKATALLQAKILEMSKRI
ncbi:MAG: lysophospholipid acyltransferase family protein [Christensenellaceae bacterium]